MEFLLQKREQQRSRIGDSVLVTAWTNSQIITQFCLYLVFVQIEAKSDRPATELARLIVCNDR